MIKNEEQYMVWCAEALWLDVKVLKLKQQPCDAFDDFLVAECEVKEIEENVASIRKDLAKYDATYFADRRGKWFPTFSRHRFWPEDPRPEDIHLNDIAHALARINRFNGHTRSTYSVAQHVVLGSYHVHPKCAKAFIMHDVGETYLGDVITPIKRLFREFYDNLEQAVVDAAAKAFSFTMTPHEKGEVKRMDNVMLATEIRDLTPSMVYNGCLQELPLEQYIVDCWSPEEAEKRFLGRFHELFQ